ncbi:hypothetical protein [Melittangium boletus]|uniref:Uncharacterized protein n=1 Tax=Melittangium boletus DSM 14713 TaxID=1294270 RepID=A0A250ITC4_9BACT|nr:hypothetical protein [Melittangium boletus]ATB34437.1 hypothetical protein MEBOL_007940 [Melittangium boletus DSM 14713]
MTQPEWLKTAVRKSPEHKWTLGYIFETAHRIEGKSPEDLAAELDCSLETLDWLALCRRPEEDRFAEHLRIITDRFNLAPLPLVRLIRRVESLAAFSRRDEGEARSGSTLLAARDRSDDDERES